MINHYNYLYTKQLALDLPAVKTSCIQMRDIIIENFSHMPGFYPQKDLLTTHVFNHYNVLMYPLDQFHELYFEIQKMYREICESSTQMYIQCWLNFYNKGQFIDWHGHLGSGLNSFHGFYCVDVEPNSFTSYKFPVNGDQIFVDIESKNNLLVMGKTDNDQHRSSVWTHDYPRITIAYDIVPKEYVPIRMLNHWIPI